MKNRYRISGVVLMLLIVISAFSSRAQADLKQDEDGDNSPDPGIRMDFHHQTGKVTFIGASPDQPIEIQTDQLGAVLPEQPALTIMGQFAPLFGINDPASELDLLSVNQDPRGKTSTRFQQVYQGIPIIAGEIMVNTDPRGALLSINGEISPDLDLDPLPQIPPEQASEIALAAISDFYGLSEGELTATGPELWIYDARLFTPRTVPPALVWRMAVAGVERIDIDELVLIDAVTGGVRLHFNQVDTAKDRETYNANNSSSLPGTLRCDESNPTCAGGDSHEVAAHLYAGDTYDFYWNYHGRDSVDDAGMTLVSSVHYGVNYKNAFWSRLDEQMVYGDAYGYPLADDVVGHELTHGVTNAESALLYYYESGAINESLSDIWGEFVDQVNGAGDDSAGVKWLMGEDITGLGAIRDMEDPTVFGDPDRMLSPNYYITSGDWGDPFFDQGGVHINSGVNNKAAYLMTDGGTFNGQVVSPLGIAKVAAIYYEAQTNLLTSGSGFADLYNLLYQGCLTLIGGAEGITGSDCQEVLDALNAVEMNQEPDPGYNPDPVSCPGGEFPALQFIDNLEAGTANWTSGALQGTDSWTWDSGYSSSGDRMLYGYDGYTLSDSYVELIVDVPLPGGTQPYLHFRHAFGFEDSNMDGGLIDYSINGGSTWTDAGSLFDGGLDYTGTISTLYLNPNGGSQAFVGDSHGYVGSRYDLSSLTGNSVRFRWRVSTDISASDLGWVIDDVRIYICDQGILAPLIVKN